MQRSGPWKPAHVLRAAAARHHADHRGLGRIPAPVDLARLQPLLAGDIATEGDHHVPVRERHVVDHADIGHLHRDFVTQAPRGIEGRDVEVVIGQAIGLVAEAHHLAAERIEFRVGAERLAVPVAAAVPDAARGERVRVEFVRQTVFLQRVELAVMGERRGVGHRAGVGPGQVAHRLVVRERIAVVAVEVAARCHVAVEPFGADPATVVIDAAIADAEAAGIAIGVEDGVIGLRGRIEPLGPYPVERAVDVGGDLADHLAIDDVRLEADRCPETPAAGGLRVVSHDVTPSCCFSPAGRTGAVSRSLKACRISSRVFITKGP